MELPIISYTITYNTYEWNTEHMELELAEHTISPFNSTNYVLSYNYPSNCIYISFIANKQLDYIEARVTDYNDPTYGVGIGTLAAYIDGSKSNTIVANTPTELNIPINTTTFPNENLALNKSFRVGLYAKCHDNGSWDATYLLFDSDNKKIIPTDKDGIEVLTTEQIPD